MEKIKQNAFVKKVGFNRIILVAVMLLMYLAFGALTGGKFFTVSRLMNIFNYVYFLGFLALGVTFVIATGGIDFSIGPVMFCCALVSGYSFFNHGIPMGVALVLCILDGCGIRKETDGNAFANANKPTIDMLLEKYPNSTCF